MQITSVKRVQKEVLITRADVLIMLDEKGVQLPSKVDVQFEIGNRIYPMDSPERHVAVRWLEEGDDNATSTD